MFSIFTMQFNTVIHVPYVDDIMLCFKNWRQACALMPSFLDMLNSIGMKVNFSKSCVIVDAVLLRAAATECTSPLLREFQWSETTSYLNRPFGYQVSVETLCQQVAQKVHAAWVASEAFWGDAGGQTRPKQILF